MSTRPLLKGGSGDKANAGTAGYGRAGRSLQ